MKINAVLTNISNKNSFGNMNIVELSQKNAQSYNIEPKEVKTNTTNTTLIVATGVGIALLAAGILCRKQVSKVFKTVFSKQPEPLTKPTYLYHMTSKGCYESIVRDGVVKTSSFDGGLYMSHKQNIQKHYTENDIRKMINFYDGGNWAEPSPHRHSGSVVLLKIPVNKLNEDLLGFRQIPLVGRDNRNISQEIVKFKDYLAESSQGLMDKPLEFIYQGEVPFSDVEKVIEISTKNLNNASYVKNFFKKF